MKVNEIIAEQLYLRPLVSKQRQEFGHSVIWIHLETTK